MADYAAEVRVCQPGWSEADIAEDAVEEMIHRHGQWIASAALEVADSWSS